MTAATHTSTRNNTQTKSGEPSTTMRAATQRSYGTAEVLNIETIQRPTIADDEVLVEVVAAGLDRGVWHLMTGLPYLVRLMGYGFRRPKNPVPGADVAGRVVQVGSTVSRFNIGDEVFGIAQGSFAEYAAAKESKLTHKPSNIPFDQAAAAPISGVTALQALTTIGHLEPGQHVLVIGASGGVGSFAVQLAKALGATVTGVASTPQLETVWTLGADHVIDYTTTQIDDGEQRYDLIIDIGGRNKLSRIRRALTPKGTLVIVGGEGGDRLTGGIGRQLRASMISPFIKQRLAFFISTESLESIELLAKHLGDRSVVPAIGQHFALNEVPVALQAMEDGALTAKAVICVAP